MSLFLRCLCEHGGMVLVFSDEWVWPRGYYDPGNHSCNGPSLFWNVGHGISRSFSRAALSERGCIHLHAVQLSTRTFESEC